MSAGARLEIGEKVRTAAPSLIALAALIAILYFGRVFIITLTTAVIVSFMLEPLVGLAMRLKMPRGLASFVVCSFALLALYLAGVGVYTQVSDLMDELPAYSDRINELIDGVSLQMEEMDKTAYRILVPKRIQERDKPPVPVQPPPEARRKRQNALPVPLAPPPIPEVRIRTERQPLINYIYDYVSRLYSALLMASFVPFLVVLHAELAGSPAAGLPVSFPKRGTNDGGQGVGGDRQHGAGFCRW